MQAHANAILGFLVHTVKIRIAKTAIWEAHLVFAKMVGLVVIVTVYAQATVLSLMENAFANLVGEDLSAKEKFVLVEEVYIMVLVNVCRDIQGLTVNQELKFFFELRELDADQGVFNHTLVKNRKSPFN